MDRLDDMQTALHLRLAEVLAGNPMYNQAQPHQHAVSAATLAAEHVKAIRAARLGADNNSLGSVSGVAGRMERADLLARLDASEKAHLETTRERDAQRVRADAAEAKLAAVLSDASAPAKPSVAKGAKG